MYLYARFLHMEICTNVSLYFLVSAILNAKHTFFWVYPFLTTVGFVMANLNGGKICGRNVTQTCLCWDHINCKTLI
jgi:hypothetical protein